MPSPYEDNMIERGRYGGDRPGSFDSDAGHAAYESGRTQRELDRTTNDALEKLHNPDYANRNKF